jgi:replication initiation protein RepC
MTLALLAAQKTCREIPKAKIVDKWQVYRDLCEGKALVGVGDRSLAVLAALLSFYPSNELSEESRLIVFPSNKQLSLRSHGMANATLRRHLAALLDAGLVTRRDSPNGKRYARKGSEGSVEEAFGFSLAPLLARAEEFQCAAERIRAEHRGLKLLRERITLHRRDIHKLIEAAVEHAFPGDWADLWRRFRAIVEAIPRKADLRELEAIEGNLVAIRNDVDKMLENIVKSQNPSANESHNELQQSESNTYILFESEPAPKRRPATIEPETATKKPPKGYPLGIVLKACPEITHYALEGIENWRDLMATAAQVGAYLGVSRSAYEDACHAMGPEAAATVIACILQRAQHINSAGGYLRALTEKARVGDFSAGPMLMTAYKANSPSAKQSNISGFSPPARLSN